MPSELFLNPDPLRDGADMLAQNCLAPDWFPTTVPSARENPVVGFGLSLAKTLGALSFTPLTMLQACRKLLISKSVVILARDKGCPCESGEPNILRSS
jgi:hypothetical protein